MKICNLFSLPIAIFTAHLICGAQPTDTTLKRLVVGDKAPDLKIEKWISGGGFQVLNKGKIYLIDLWATWCVPCIAGMPHLSNLQQQYKQNGLEVIGITSEDKFGNTLENVEKFVSGRQKTILYNVAWVPVSIADTLEGIWLHPWMKASGSDNLPTCFLIDRNGTIAYIGDPLTVDATLNEIVGEQYDISEFKRDYISGRDAANFLPIFNTALKAGMVDSAVQSGKYLLTKFHYVRPNTYLMMAWQVAHFQGTMRPDLLQLGLDAIARGLKLTGFSSPAYFDVLAAIYATGKNYVSAIAAEKAAISLSEGDMQRGQMRTLQKYLELALANKD